jgi:hypothetical protein
METMIELIYITPIAAAFLWRLVWWIWFSPSNAPLFPDRDDDVDLTMLALVFWPVTLFCIVVLLLVIAICSPFWAVVRAIRNARLTSGSQDHEHDER